MNENEQDIVAGNKASLETKFKTKFNSFFSYILCFVPLLLRIKEHL